ncbi:FtsQ-type POTRA domain-containing protein [Corynebacterium callunae]|uniref:cell division protein FtsQ/DivIB n=1 Tax=Corynebacterium callunae TaxID=1721 RepID=UPI00398263B3
MPVKKKTIAIAAVSLVVIAAILAVVAWFVPILKVNTIEVTGAPITGAVVVEETSGITVGENLLRVDASGAAHKIAELPWVKTVTINRKIPSTIAIEVQERVAAVFQNTADGNVIYDTEGKPIIIGTPPPGTVEVTATDAANEAILPAVISVINSIRDQDAALLNNVATVEAPDQYDILLKLKDGREIYWGSAENNHDKAVAMATVVKREGQHWNISSPSMVSVR